MPTIKALILARRRHVKKYFEFAYIPYLETRKYLNFTKNNKDKIQFDVYEHI